MKELKKQLRKAIAQKKSQFSPGELDNFSNHLLYNLEQLPAFKQATTVLLFHSLKDEVRTHEFVEKWKDKKNILLPVVIGDDLELRKYTGKHDLSIGAYGIEEPIGEPFGEFDRIDLAIVPGVSFDPKRNRLGRGKGYYDRLLPRIKSYKIGICFSFQVSKEVPAETFDIRMDAVLTDKGLLSEK